MSKHQDLRTAGEGEWSTTLLNALAISGMTGEILAEVRYELRKLRRTEIPKHLHLEDRIREALDFIDSQLGPWDEGP